MGFFRILLPGLVLSAFIISCCSQEKKVETEYVMVPRTLPVDLPEEKTSPTEGVNEPLKVIINNNNKTYINDFDHPIDSIDFENQLRQHMETGEYESIKLIADKDARWGYGIHILSLAKKNEWKIVIPIDDE